MFNRKTKPQAGETFAVNYVGHGQKAANQSHYSRGAVVVGALLMPALAMATGPDVSAITDAGVTAAAYAAAIGGVLAVIWGLKLAYRKFFGG